MTKDEILLARREHLFPAVGHYYAEPLAITHAKDQYLYDSDGRQYLDFFGGIVVVSVGHCNERVNRAVHEQIDRLGHVSELFATEPESALAQKIASLTPEGKLTKCFFTCSGTEANETAIAVARCYTGTSEVVALRHSYHGRSAMGLTMTGQSTWRPLPSLSPGVVHAVNAYCYRCPFGLKYPECDIRCAHDVEETIRTSTCGRIAAYVAEPIQGGGGMVTPPPEYFRVVEEIVHRYGGVFISDEVQTGWGRTGKWFGIEHYGVVPDILVSAKGLANGLPIGVTVARPEVADALPAPGISTFGGNPVCATAARAVLDFIESENLLANAERMGAYLRAGLEELQKEFPLIGDVRGMGLLQTVELVRDRGTKEPAPEETRQVMEATRRNGLIVGKCGFHGNCLRISPPLNIGAADIDECLRLLNRSLKECTAAAAAH